MREERVSQPTAEEIVYWHNHLVNEIVGCELYTQHPDTADMLNSITILMEERLTKAGYVIDSDEDGRIHLF